jgi:DNA-binding MarR family transcriptional regulator
MAGQGWIGLQADANDQRRTMVIVTAMGRRLVKPLVQDAKQHEERMLRPLGTIEKAALRKLLEKLAHPA